MTAKIVNLPGVLNFKCYQFTCARIRNRETIACISFGNYADQFNAKLWSRNGQFLPFTRVRHFVGFPKDEGDAIRLEKLSIVQIGNVEKSWYCLDGKGGWEEGFTGAFE